MAAVSGPKVSTDGLVFSYDLDNPQSLLGRPTTNVLTGKHDPTFESYDVGSNNAGFFNQLDSGGTADIVSTFSYKGSKSLRITSGVDTASPPYGRLYNTYSIGAGEVWTFSAWVYAEEPGSFLAIELFGGDYTYGVNQSRNYHLGTGWERLYVTIQETTTASTLYYFIYPRPYPNQTIYVDQIQLEQQEVATIFTPSARTSTQVLIDQSATTDITAQSLTYGPNDEVSYNGAENKITANLTTTIFSLEVWIYNRSTIPGLPGADGDIGGPSQYQSIIGFNNVATAGVNLGGWTSSMTNEAVHIWSWNLTGVSLGATYTNQQIAPGWHHFAFNWNGSDYDIWIDGEKQPTFAQTGNGSCKLLTGISSIQVGGNETSGYYFYGDIPVVKAYDQQRTDAEVLQNYRALKNRFSTKVIAESSYTPPANIKNGLVAAYDATTIITDGASNIQDFTFRDLSRYGHDIKLYGGFQYDETENALYGLPPSGLYVPFGKSVKTLDLRNSTAITVISVWRYTTTSPTGSPMLYEHSADWNSVNDSYGGFGFSPFSNGSATVSDAHHIQLRGNVGYSGVNAAVQADSNYHMYAITHDFTRTSGNETYAYLDGTFINKSDSPANVAYNAYNANNTGKFGNEHLYLFSRGGNLGYNSTDKLKMLFIYDRKLSDQEITDFYNALSL